MRILITILFLFLCLPVFAEYGGNTGAYGSVIGGGGSATNISGGVFNNVTLTGSSSIPNASNAQKAGGVTLNTNVFNVKDYGAFGDGQFVSDISATNGSIYVSSPNGHWGATNINNHIGLCACGFNGKTWWTGISNVISPAMITVSNAPPFGTTNGYYCVYGLHDESSAFQATINTAMNLGGGHILIPPGVYLFSTNFVSPNEENAMLNIPYIGASTFPQGSPSLSIEGNFPSRLWGAGTAGYYNPYPQSSVLVVMANGNDITSSNCMGSSFITATPYEQGAPMQNGATHFDGIHLTIYPANNACVRLSNLTIITGYDPHLAVVNLMGATDGSGMDNVQIVGGNINGTAFMSNPPSGTNDYGYIPPGNFEGTFDKSSYDFISGFYSGIECGCFYGNQITINLCSNAYDCYLQTGVFEYSHAANISDCPNILANTRGADSGGGYGTLFDFDIASIQGTTTGESGWWTNNNFIIEAINDPNGKFSYPYGQGRMFLPYTNAVGQSMAINWIKPFGPNLTYLGSGPPYTLHYTDPVSFDGGVNTTNITSYLFYSGIPDIAAINSEDDYFFGGGSGNLTANDGGFGKATGVGYTALRFLTSGSGDTAVGFKAESSLTTASDDTAIGSQSLLGDVNGSQNTAIGSGALPFIVSQGYITALGYQAGLNYIGVANDGTVKDIFIGAQAGLNLTNGDNDIDIGNQGITNETGVTRVGMGASTVTTYIDGSITGNGGGLTNISPTNVVFSVVNTNWILGGKYTFPFPVQVSANACLSVAGVSGEADLELEIVGNTTNRSSISTTVSSISENYTNFISGLVPANATFDFTNRSAGAGDSATVSGGQYIIQ